MFYIYCELLKYTVYGGGSAGGGGERGYPIDIQVAQIVNQTSTILSAKNFSATTINHLM